MVISGAPSDWNFIFAGVPQGSNLDLCVPVIYNDIVKNMVSNIRLLADDTGLFKIVKHYISATHLYYYYFYNC